MRKLLNQCLSPLGYELRRIDRFRHEFDRLLRRRASLRFVQIGAHDGVSFDSLHAMVTAHRCAGLVIEPLPDIFARLVANYASQPQIKPINKAVHATEESLLLYRVTGAARANFPAWMDGIASFDRQHLLRHGVPLRDIEAQQVECIALMDLMSAEGFLDADVLQVDVEGYDAEVIRMIDFDKFKPALIKYEHKNLSTVDRRSIVALLKRQDYRVARQAEDTVAWRR